MRAAALSLLLCGCYPVQALDIPSLDNISSIIVATEDDDGTVVGLVPHLPLDLALTVGERSRTVELLYYGRPLSEHGILTGRMAGPGRGAPRPDRIFEGLLSLDTSSEWQERTDSRLAASLPVPLLGPANCGDCAVLEAERIRCAACPSDSLPPPERPMPPEQLPESTDLSCGSDEIATFSTCLPLAPDCRTIGTPTVPPGSFRGADFPDGVVLLGPGAHTLEGSTDNLIVEGSCPEATTLQVFGVVSGSLSLRNLTVTEILANDVDLTLDDVQLDRLNAFESTVAITRSRVGDTTLATTTVTLDRSELGALTGEGVYVHLDDVSAFSIELDATRTMASFLEAAGLRLHPEGQGLSMHGGSRALVTNAVIRPRVEVEASSSLVVNRSIFELGRFRVEGDVELEDVALEQNGEAWAHVGINGELTIDRATVGPELTVAGSLFASDAVFREYLSTDVGGFTQLLRTIHDTDASLISRGETFLQDATLRASLSVPLDGSASGSRMRVEGDPTSLSTAGSANLEDVRLHGSVHVSDGDLRLTRFTIDGDASLFGTTVLLQGTIRSGILAIYGDVTLSEVYLDHTVTLEP